MNREEIAWAAGLFEGEGCVFHRTGRGTVAASVAMKDEDRIRELHRVLGLGTIISYGTPVMWKWAVSSFEQVQAACAMLWPWLGERRRRAFTEALQQARYHLPTRQARRTCVCGFVTKAGPMGVHTKMPGHQIVQSVVDEVK